MMSEQPRILLTGCCGYIGTWTALTFLRAGWRVRGTSIDPDYAGRVLAEACSGDPDESALIDRLEIVRADLLNAESWTGLADECFAVVHTACPVETAAGTPPAKMHDPAVLGTENVVREAIRAGNVRRFVHLSSSTALFDHHRPLARRPEGPECVGPDSWNETASPSNDPYAHAKVKAERLASRLIEENLPDTSFVSIVSGPVLGPPAGGARVPASVGKTMEPLLMGQLRAGSVPIWLGITDVTDVATVLFKAVTCDVTALGGRSTRLLCMSDPSPSLLDLANLIRASHPEYDRRLPRRLTPVPRWVLLGAMRFAVTREAWSITRAMFDRQVIYDTSDTRRRLDWSPVKVEKTVAATVDWLVAHNHFPPPR